MGRKSAGLQPKHWKALELLSEGSLSIKEVAKACDISVDAMYDLYEGNTQKMGEIAAIFHSELEKITLKNTEKIRHLTKDSKAKALKMINERLAYLKSNGKLDAEGSREVTRIMNTLAKSSPTVEFNQQVSIYKSHTPEELVYEFRRLSAIARHALDGGGVQGTGTSGTGELPDADGLGGPLAKD